MSRINLCLGSSMIACSGIKTADTSSLMIFKLIRILSAWITGIFLYVAAIITMGPYDGILTLVFAPLMGSLISAFFIFPAVVIGYFLRSQLRAPRWNVTVALLLIGLSLSIMIFGRDLGLSFLGHHPETGAEVSTLHPVAAISSYFAVIFCVANWPTMIRQAV